MVEVDAATSAAVLVGDKEEWRLLAAAAPGLAALFPPRVVLTDLSAAEVASLCVTHARQRYGLTVAADAGRLAAARGGAARRGGRRRRRGPRNAALAAAMVAEAVGRSGGARDGGGRLSVGHALRRTLARERVNARGIGKGWGGFMGGCHEGQGGAL